MALYTRAKISGPPRHTILKVVAFEDVLRGNVDSERCALWLDGSEALTRSRAAEDLSWGAFIQKTNAMPRTDRGDCHISELRDPNLIHPGDVIGVRSAKGLISSLYRRGSRNNALLVTERCNSYCVMCSQPPLERNEDGYVEELASIIQLADSDEDVLGITGGEPTLLGDGLLRLFDEVKTSLPRTGLHVLTNGRRFKDRAFAEVSVQRAPINTIWAIPLYTDSPETHDFVVQSKGAFAETMQGLWNLAGVNAHVELRIVLQRAVVPRLRQFAHFVARNLGFVDHVAWMGLEPMGFAKPNWKSIWIEPEDYMESLADAVAMLDRYGMSTSIFNIPLCVLPQGLRPYAARSISDWKRAYLPLCENCVERNKCGGFFASAVRAHIPKAVHAILPEQLIRSVSLEETADESSI